MIKNIKNIRNIKIGKKWQIFSVFVFFSTILWFLNALNQEYTTDIKVPVVFFNLPPNRANIAELPKNFTVTINAYGYNILKYQLKNKFTPLKIDLSEARFFKYPNIDTNKYFVLTKEYINFVENQLTGNMAIDVIKPDTVFFLFTTYKEKYVPVNVDATILAAAQYVIKDDVFLSPDSVLISGPAIIIDTITNVITKNFLLDKLNSNTIYVATIKPIIGVEISPLNVKINVNVEEYTELRLNVPIETINVPDSVNLLVFPNSVNIVTKVGINRYDQILQSDFKVIVDYNAIYDNMGSQLPTEIISSPDSIYDFYRTPEFVEYIIEKK